MTTFTGDLYERREVNYLQMVHGKQMKPPKAGGNKIVRYTSQED